MSEFEENIVTEQVQDVPSKPKPRAKKYKSATVLAFNEQRCCLAYECEGVVCQIFAKGHYKVGDTIKVDAECITKVVGEFGR